MKKTVVIAVLLVLALTASTFAASFSDVPANHWAYEAVNKLVAAGIIEGYPDGTYGGQRNLTRYEIAIVVSRVLDDIAAERGALEAKIDKAESGLSKDQAQDVTAIVKALMALNVQEPQVIEKETVIVEGAPAVEVPEELTQKQAEEVIALIKALTFEFRPELETLGAKVDALDDRVALLEEGADAVSFSGEYSLEFENNVVEGTAYHNPFDYDDEDEDRFIEDANVLKHLLDLNMAINKGPLSADFDLTAVANNFIGTDEKAFELDSLSGIISGNDFEAVIKEEQEESLRPYLFNGSYNDDGDWEGPVVDGVKFTVGGNRILLDGKVDLDDDDNPIEDTERYAVAGDLELNVLGGLNVVYGLSSGFDVLLEDDAVSKLVGAYKTFELAEFEVTPEVALNSGEDYYLAVGANGELGIVDATFNYKNMTETFSPIAVEDFVWEKGFDASGSLTLAEIFDITASYESYTEAPYDTNDAKSLLELAGEVTEENAADLGGFAVYGSAGYKNQTSTDDATNKLFNVIAENEIADIALTAELDYEDPTSNFVEFVDEDAEGKNDVNLDAEYTVFEGLDAYAGYTFDLYESANELSRHEYGADYAKDAITAGAKLALIGSDKIHAYAGYNVDKEEAFDVVDFAVKPYAEINYWVPEDSSLDNDKNILAGVEVDKALNEFATLTGGYEYANYEHDNAEDEFIAGLLKTAKVGLTYDVAEDVEFTADYKNMKFEGAVSTDDFKADQISAGVSVAF